MSRLRAIKRASAQPVPGALITDDPQQIALLNWLRVLSQQVNLIQTEFPFTDVSGVLTNDGVGHLSWAAGGSGSVTSVGLTMPAEFSVSGSPVTTTGTFAVTKANESANTVWAGPTSGGAAVPTFRALVTGDLP